MPVQLGDRVALGDWQIIRKLGWATSSSVWLVRRDFFRSVSLANLPVTQKPRYSLTATVGAYYQLVWEIDVIKRATLIGDSKDTVPDPGEDHCVGNMSGQEYPWSAY
ncbi:hypothetical protein BC628DRAFT_1377803 [Trametes gibbosa]|nr:hypothetical protein BC628DRAFT_1377803 [Trametes gibbosa]